MKVKQLGDMQIKQHMKDPIDLSFQNLIGLTIDLRIRIEVRDRVGCDTMRDQVATPIVYTYTSWCDRTMGQSLPPMICLLTTLGLSASFWASLSCIGPPLYRTNDHKRLLYSVPIWINLGLLFWYSWYGSDNLIRLITVWHKCYTHKIVTLEHV